MYISSNRDSGHHQKVLAALALTTTVAAILRYAATKPDSRKPLQAEASDDEDEETEEATVETAELKPRQESRKEPSVDASQSSFSISSIGTIRSIYRLCVGTPRQGLLSPLARGRVELSAENAMDMVDGLEQYSHIWIIFYFHLNTSGKKQVSKIAPPALGGQKVGVLATRSPHRASRIGMTLCQLDHVAVVKKQKQNKGPKVVLHISGLDLVDGTPVLDIKPYVPTYDSVPDQCEVPSWVSGGLATQRRVVITEQAQRELEAILKQNPKALEFYGPHCGDDHTTNVMIKCVQQVLAVDVRSAWQTNKARRGKSQAERAVRIKSVIAGTSSAPVDRNTSDNALCTQQLDNLLLHYMVDKPAAASNRPASEGSGAEDVVTVHKIQLLMQGEKASTATLTSTTTLGSDIKQETSQIPQPLPQQQDDQQQSPTDDQDEQQVQDSYFQQQMFERQALQEQQHQPKGHQLQVQECQLPLHQRKLMEEQQRQLSSRALALPQSPTLRQSRPSLPPPPKEGNYSMIQKYFAEAANVYTPKGISPSVVKPLKRHDTQPRELRNSRAQGRVLSEQNGSYGELTQLLEEEEGAEEQSQVDMTSMLAIPNLDTLQQQGEQESRVEEEELRHNRNVLSSYGPGVRRVSDSSGIYFDPLAVVDTDDEKPITKKDNRTTTTSDLSMSDDEEEEEEDDNDGQGSEYAPSDEGVHEEEDNMLWWYSVSTDEYLAVKDGAGRSAGTSVPGASMCS